MVEKAELADATRTCASLREMMAGAPEPLLQSEVMTDMKVRRLFLSHMTGLDPMDCSGDALLYKTTLRSKFRTHTRAVS